MGRGIVGVTLGSARAGSVSAIGDGRPTVVKVALTPSATWVSTAFSSVPAFGIGVPTVHANSRPARRRTAANEVHLIDYLAVGHPTGLIVLHPPDRCKPPVSVLLRASITLVQDADFKSLDGVKHIERR